MNYPYARELVDDSHSESILHPQRRQLGTIRNDNNYDMHGYNHDKYAPEHPDADWGGFVARSYKKKHSFQDHIATRDNLVVDAKGGIIPDLAASSKSSSFSGKKMFDPSTGNIHTSSSVTQVGPGSDRSCRDWKTSYEAQSSMDATPKETYALGTQQNAQHKRHVVPMYEKSVPERRARGCDAIDNNSGSRGNSPSGLIGAMRPRLEPRKSLLSDIGKLVAAEDVNNKLARPEHHLSHSYIDPTNKSLIAENSHYETLGYTGRRRPSLR